MAQSAPASVSLPASPGGRFAAWMRTTLVGRAIAIGLSLTIAGVVLRRIVGGSLLLDVLTAIGAVSLLVGIVAAVVQLVRGVAGRLLWRVRSKLTFLYIFIGFVPALLIIAFFVTAGWFFFMSIGMYVMRSNMLAHYDHVGFLAQSAALDLQRLQTAAEVSATLERRQSSAALRYPNVAYVAVPLTSTCRSDELAGADAVIVTPVAAGRWDHLEPPGEIPAWATCDGFAGLILYTGADGNNDGASNGGGATRFAMRGVALPDDPARQYAVVVDVPLSQTLVEQFKAQTGIEIGDISASGLTDDERRPRDRAATLRDEGSWAAEYRPPLRSASRADGWSVLNLFAGLPYTHWEGEESGQTDTAWISFRMALTDIYSRISEAPTPLRDINMTFGDVFLALLAVLGGLILVIQAATFGMGLALARSISGSVHELFTGTMRLRRGDFTHQIAVRSKDQLGELADSFNSMTASIRDLLQQKAEKDRLEQELLIARRIQMSLLPQGLQAFPGVVITGHCEPAREVGGDYYDVIPLDDHRLGLLIADVAGKGTSAALYMAELKGIVLSLCQYHASPRQLLIDADRILARHLDSRSFITVTYAVIDTRAGTLTYARAGHCPLIHVPGPEAPSRAPQILVPDGMVLGLQLDRGDVFARLLQEATLPLAPGDLLLLYTDGITEAMSPDGDFFGDVRLAQLVRDHSDLSTADIRDVILREVRVFSGTAMQHDDMTLLVLKMEDVGAALRPVSKAPAVVAEMPDAGTSAA